MDELSNVSAVSDCNFAENYQHINNRGKVFITCGRNMKKLEREIVAILQSEDSIVEMNVKQFADGEICMDYQTSIRGGDLFIIKSICGPDINSALMEALLSVDAAHRSMANRVTLICPYYGYARQDRVAYPR